MTTCPVCLINFDPVNDQQDYCTSRCRKSAAHARSKGLPISMAARRAQHFCKRCGVNIGHRGLSATYCESCTKGHDRCDHRTPDRAAAKHTAKLALERLANRGKAAAASKHYHGGVKPLNPKIQAAIDRVVERAIADGTCYGSG